MIPTQYKARLSGHLSYPIGAEAISQALEDAPGISHFVLKFHESPVWPASSFLKILAESQPYSIVKVYLSNARKPSFSASNDMIARGFYERRQEITVFPVKRTSRHAAHRLLIEQGLPFVHQWLSGEKLGHESVVTCISLDLVFHPDREVLSYDGSRGPTTNIGR